MHEAAAATASATPAEDPADAYSAYRRQRSAGYFTQIAAGRGGGGKAGR